MSFFADPLNYIPAHLFGKDYVEWVGPSLGNPLTGHFRTQPHYQSVFNEFDKQILRHRGLK